MSATWFRTLDPGVARGVPNARHERPNEDTTRREWTMTQPSDDFTTNDDMQRVTQDVSNRLTGLGVTLTGEETPEQLVQIQEAVERFELAVESRGGDLMVDEGPDGRTTEPDDPHFVLPLRGEGEPVDHYVERLVFATDEVRRQPPQ